VSGFVLGVDLGTGGPRVALVGANGVLVAHEKETVDLRLLPGGGAEQDPDDWWRAIVAASRLLRERHPHEYAQVTAICMSSQWGGLVPVDAEGRHVHPALTWMDSRGSRYSQELTGGGLRVPGGYNARALRHWLSRTGGVPTRTGKDPVGQAAWLRHERPDVDAAAAYLLDVPEYLTMRLTNSIWVRTEDYAFNARCDSTAARLIDLRADPGQDHDLASARPQVTRELFDLALRDAGGELPIYTRRLTYHDGTWPDE